MANAAIERSPGRPRRFDPETELQMILDATTNLLKTRTYEDVSVGSILAESGLSTRSFYRHFASKDELLIVLHNHNAAQAGKRLAIRMARAASSLEAVESWVDEVLSFGYDPRKARRAAIFTAPSARRTPGYGAAVQAAMKLVTDPLQEAIERGRLDGSFPLALPDRDARSIAALVWDVISWTPRRLSRAEARAQVLRFALPGLGASSTPAASSPRWSPVNERPAAGRKSGR
jgi:AcrR family transcriptional regulator